MDPLSYPTGMPSMYMDTGSAFDYDIGATSGLNDLFSSAFTGMYNYYQDAYNQYQDIYNSNPDLYSDYENVYNAYQDAYSNYPADANAYSDQLGYFDASMYGLSSMGLDSLYGLGDINDTVTIQYSPSKLLKEFPNKLSSTE